MHRVLQNLISDIRRLFGIKNIVLNTSDMDSEFLNNFDNIGDYNRVFPSQTQLNVEFPQTKSNSSKGMMDRRDIYAPSINSFSVSSHQACSSQTKVRSNSYKMKNSFSNEFHPTNFDRRNEPIIQNDNFVYVKRINGYIKNWDLNNKEWNDISPMECTTPENCQSASSYFNMHNLKNEESKKPGSVLLLDLYMS